MTIDQITDRFTDGNPIAYITKEEWEEVQRSFQELRGNLKRATLALMDIPASLPVGQEAVGEVHVGRHEDQPSRFKFYASAEFNNHVKDGVYKVYGAPLEQDEPLYITHAPLIGYVISLLRLRPWPGFEEAAKRLEMMLEGEPTPSQPFSELSKKWHDVAEMCELAAPSHAESVEETITPEQDPEWMEQMANSAHADSEPATHPINAGVPPLCPVNDGSYTTKVEVVNAGLEVEYQDVLATWVKACRQNPWNGSKSVAHVSPTRLKAFSEAYALSAVEQYKADAERLNFIEKNCRTDPKMDGQHVYWPTTFNNALRGPDLRTAIDQAIRARNGKE